MSTTEAVSRIDSTIALALQDEALERAQALARGVTGLVIQNDAEAAHISDRLAVIKDGRKLLAAKLTGLLGPIRALESRARDAFRPIDNVLRDAEDVCKAEMGRYLIQKEREAKEERIRLEREAAEVSARQAREAQTGPVPPPLELPPPEAPETVIQGRKSTTYVTTRLCVEIIDVHAVASYDPSLLILDETKAKNRLRAEIAAMGASEEVVMCGMRFWRERSIGNR